MAALPKGFGLSAKYPGDRGIAKDPSVLFAEDFEAGPLEAIKKRWSEASDKGGRVLALSSDVPKASSGKTSLRISATLSENTGGHLYKRFDKGVDQVFVRFYVKFPEEADYIHHFVHLGGYNPPTSYPQGGAGERPRGDDRVTVGIESYGGHGKYPPPGFWTFYAYWHEMKVSGDGKYWGNGMSPAVPPVVPRNRWQCVEVMMKLNSTPQKRDGALALWLDGRPEIQIVEGVRRGPWTGMGFQLRKDGEPFEGFHFRTSEDLKINFLWLLHYVTENAARQSQQEPPKRPVRVWFDDIVVSTNYVGPIKPRQR
ncbi:MAG: hypothetical protein KY468_13020 [Armatimonadetes bacterium]|nr:hypothetical protein [Armatimonadota bacterium]